MTAVAFHFNVADKLGYSCRLLRKVVAQGNRAMVTADPSTLVSLDKLLWEFSAQDFIAHACIPVAAPEPDPEGQPATAATAVSAPVPAHPSALTRSPVLLGTRANDCPHGDVLVNLDPEVPLGFERFERLVELVGTDESDRQAARQRWKHYKERGYAIVRHDVLAQAS